MDGNGHGAASLLPAGIAPQNVTREPRALHMELLDPRSADVWLCQAPVTAPQFAAFRPDPPLIKSGLAHAAMDMACFLRSPDAAQDGPLETRTIGGLEFARVARPLKFRGFAPGDAPTALKVVKHHLIGFDAGARVLLARLPDGAWYVQQTVSAQGARITVPADWTLHELRAAAPWSVYVEPPASVYFFRNLSSFMGPVPRGQIPGEPLRTEPPHAV